AVFLSSTQVTSANNMNEKNSEKGTEATTTQDAIAFFTPVALRPLVSPPIAREDQGCYSSGFRTNNIQIKLGTLFWNLARDYRQQLVEGTLTPKGVQNLLQRIGLYKYLPNKPQGWENYLRSLVTAEHGGRPITLVISNVGSGWGQDPATAIAFEVLEAAFSQSACTTGPAITLGASTANGVLSVTAGWQKATFSSRDRPELFLKAFKRILLEASSPERQEYCFQEALTFDET
ncbi:hypothetical protein BGZ70_002726, partial [Mortierella alpina]